MHPTALLAKKTRELSAENASRMPPGGFADTYPQDRSSELDKLKANEMVADAVVPVRDALGPPFWDTIGQNLDATAMCSSGWARHFYPRDRAYACNFSNSALKMMAKAEALGVVVAFMPIADYRPKAWDSHMNRVSLCELVAQFPVETSLLWQDAMCGPKALEEDVVKLFEYTAFSARAVFATTFGRTRGCVDKAEWARSGRVSGFVRRIKELCQRKSRVQATLLLADFHYGKMVTLVFSVFTPRMPATRGETDEAVLRRLEERDALCGQGKKKRKAPADLPPLYCFEAILDRRGSGAHLQYLVAWEGYDERTWEPAANVPEGSRALQRFLDSKKRCGHCKGPLPSPQLTSSVTGQPVSSCRRCYLNRGGKPINA